MNNEVTTAATNALNPLENILGKLNFSDIVIPSIRLSDIVDIILVAILIYTIIHWIKETRAYTLFKGLLFIILISFLSYNLHFYTLTWIIEKTLSVGIIAVVIIFQPELRKALEQIGKGGINKVTGLLQTTTESGKLSAKAADEITAACVKMAQARTGALLVIERNVPVGDIINSSGVSIDAVISSQLLINIFEDKTPLHDGAVIIRENRIAAASCILPVTESNIAQELGTRHRAAVGGSEVSDAFVIVVSEETGSISLARDGRLKRGLSEAQLKKTLYTLVESSTQSPININKLWKGMNKNEKNN